ncbi:MAG TPA: PAS domain-containing protein [Candidatus Contendobacter sp.]|nr:PAS domain-containing protein [Candidatus Contendobacter sp.]
MKILPVTVLVLALSLLRLAIAQGPDPAMLPLTAQERAWLASNPTVRARLGDYPPYMLTTPEPAGLAVDYLNYVAKRFGFKVEFIPATTSFDIAVADVGGAHQHYDLLPTFTRTPEREQQFAITNDYLTAPWVLYARQDSPYIIGLESLAGKTIAAEKGFLVTQKLKQDFPRIRILEMITPVDALMAVATGQADGYVGNLTVSNFLVKEHRLSNLVVAAPTPYGINTQAMAVRKDWPELAGLINKGLAAMTDEERQTILQKWIGVEMRLQPDYTLVWQILVAAMLIVLAIFYWNRRLAREIVIRQRIESELRNSKAQLQQEKQALQRAEIKLHQEQTALRELNETLERRVEERTAEVRAATAAILEREESLNFVVDGSRLGTWDWNIETGEVRRNDYWAGMLGYTRQEADDATAGGWLELIHPDDRERAWQSIDAHLAGQTPLHEVEYRMRARDGSYRWILDRARIVSRNSEGRAVRMAGTHQDITERKRAEQQVRDSAHHLHRLFENVPIGMFQSTPKGQYVFVNPALAAMLGFDSPAQTIETINRTSVAEATYADPSRRPLLVEEVEQHEGQFRTFQNRYRRRDGSVFDALLCFSEQTDPFSGERFLYGFIQDISERVQAEAQVQETLRLLQVATDAADIGIWSWEFASGKLEWDDRLCAWYEAPEEMNRTGLCYEFWKSRVHPDDRERAESALAAPLHNNAPHEDDFRLLLPSGRVRYIHMAAVVERDANGQPWRMVGVNRDITQQHELEAALRAAKGAAETASAAKSEFLAHMSHEIRTPMNAVLGLAQVLGREPLTANQHDMLERIQAAGRSLLVILNDILDFSKIEAGQLRLESRPFDLAGLLARIGSLMEQTAQTKGLTFCIAAPTEPLGPLLGDGLRLEQVLVNLASNALKFTERGEVTIAVHLLERNETVVRVRFTVRDTGIGIAPEALDHLFTPFTQAEAGITRRFGGTGLGLAICKRLVALMGGEIGAESQVGQGSTFWVELPFARAVQGAVTTQAAPKPALPAGPRLSGVRVLVVDDSAMNRDVVERALGLEGATAMLAADGQQAIECLKARLAAFDVVLMDVQMPVMDGLTATRLIRRDLGLMALPIIAFTAGVLPEQQAAAREAGANDVLAKPLDLEQMTAMLLQWVKPHSVALPSPPPQPSPTRGEGVGGSPSPPWAGVGGRGERLPDDFPAIPGIDRGQAAQTLDGDRAFFLRLLDGFLTEFGAAAAQTRRDLVQSDRETAARRIHTLRGNAGNLGALELMATAGALEEAIRRGEMDVETGLESLDRQLAALTAASAPWRGLTEAPAPPASAAAPPLAPEQLEALRADLRDYNLKALRRFKELKPALVGALGAAKTGALEHAIRGMRFDEALAALERC